MHILKFAVVFTMSRKRTDKQINQSERRENILHEVCFCLCFPLKVKVMVQCKIKFTNYYTCLRCSQSVDTYLLSKFSGAIKLTLLKSTESEICSRWTDIFLHVFMEKMWVTAVVLLVLVSNVSLVTPVLS